MSYPAFLKGKLNPVTSCLKIQWLLTVVRRIPQCCKMNPNFLLFGPFWPKSGHFYLGTYHNHLRNLFLKTYVPKKKKICTWAQPRNSSSTSLECGTDISILIKSTRGNEVTYRRQPHLLPIHPSPSQNILGKLLMIPCSMFSPITCLC